MGTTQLQLYNLSLLHVTDRNLSATSDAVSARYALDDAYAGALDHCLSQGYWNFAMRQSEESDDATSAIGYTYSFTKPADCVRLYNLYADASLSSPLLRYEDRGGKWHAELDTLYAVYVSNHTDPEHDEEEADAAEAQFLATWPQLFTNYVALYLARMIANRLGAGALFGKLAELEVRALRKALAVDGMDEPVRFPPAGGWASARAGGANSSRGQR